MSSVSSCRFLQFFDIGVYTQCSQCASCPITAALRCPLRSASYKMMRREQQLAPPGKKQNKKKQPEVCLISTPMSGNKRSDVFKNPTRSSSYSNTREKETRLHHFLFSLSLYLLLLTLIHTSFLFDCPFFFLLLTRLTHNASSQKQPNVTETVPFAA